MTSQSEEELQPTLKLSCPIYELMDKRIDDMSDKELMEFTIELRQIYSSPKTLKSRFSTKIVDTEALASEITDAMLGIT